MGRVFGRDVHARHDGEHAEAGGEPEHHGAVAAPEPVLPLPELGGMLADGLVAQVVHHRRLDGHAAVGEDQGEDVVGDEVAEELPFRHPPEVADIARGS